MDMSRVLQPGIGNMYSNQGAFQQTFSPRLKMGSSPTINPRDIQKALNQIDNDSDRGLNQDFAGSIFRRLPESPVLSSPQVSSPRALKKDLKDFSIRAIDDNSKSLGFTQKVSQAKEVEEDKQPDKNLETPIPLRKDSVQSQDKVKNPKRPLSPYIYFSQEKRKEIKKQFPELNSTQIMKKVSQLWNQLSIDEKDRYKEMSDVDRKRYENQKHDYDTQKEKEIMDAKNDRARNKDKDQPTRQAAMLAKQKLIEITSNKVYHVSEEDQMSSYKTNLQNRQKQPLTLSKNRVNKSGRLSSQMSPGPRPSSPSPSRFQQGQDNVAVNQTFQFFQQFYMGQHPQQQHQPMMNMQQPQMMPMGMPMHQFQNPVSPQANFVPQLNFPPGFQENFQMQLQQQQLNNPGSISPQQRVRSPPRSTLNFMMQDNDQFIDMQRQSAFMAFGGSPDPHAYQEEEVLSTSARSQKNNQF